MAVGENAGGVDLGANAGSSSRDFDAGGAPESDGPKDLDARQPVVRMVEPAGGLPVLRPHQDPAADSAAASAAYYIRVQQFHPQHRAAGGFGGILEKGLARSGAGVVVAKRADGVVVGRKGDAAAAAAAGGGEGFNREMRDLEELLSKLNPMAEEFVPPSLANHSYAAATGGGVGVVDAGFDSNGFGAHHAVANGGVNGSGRRRSGYGQGKRRMNSRTTLAQREEVIRRTVYVSYIDHQVTEEQLAALFINCGQVVDCRMCGDPNSVLRFAFIEFTDEEGARAALNLSGTVLGYYPVRVLPSKTAIAPVNPTFLPRSDDEREMCARTVYCTNIDKKVSQADVKLFFESLCGEVYRLRLLGDYHHSTRIAFVEFVMAESATTALNCSGAILGSLPIRISPSKTPVRPRAPRQPMS
ncbi:polyadenylate-binding protein-interacting protein 11-like isoform X1 [Phoenix dactylifera]|uniref:Polyadenylate-binding protein-interacting protein 11-like isoform X1 n=1 Tax=Phoenix dactylifera TaxID=42345 RepID=A0A8B7BGU2_PHODC|nr:polyadenylate-binding protein-interacting protein 11-like isoform X1 [Phoenix dactylifera]